MTQSIRFGNQDLEIRSDVSSFTTETPEMEIFQLLK